MLAAEPAATAELPAADLVTDYTSGSFSDFFAEDAAAGGGDGAAMLPAASGRAGAASGAAGSAAAHVRRARRWQSLGIGLAVLIAAAIIGEFALDHRAGNQAKATETPLGITSTAPSSATPAATPSATASASATPAPTPAAVPAQQVVPAATGQQPEPTGPPSHRRGFLLPGRLPGHDVLPGWPFLLPGLGGGHGAIVLRIVLPFPGFPPGGLPSHGGFGQR